MDETVLTRCGLDERQFVAETAVAAPARRNGTPALQLAQAGADDIVAPAAAVAPLGDDPCAPLKSILDLCDVILEERLGPIGSDGCRDLVLAIRRAGAHSLALLDGAGEPAGAGAGAGAEAKAIRAFPDAASLNGVVQTCVMELQALAQAAHVILRLSLSPASPRVVATTHTVRPLVEHLLSHALKTSRRGGQLIVTTATAANGDGVLRVRNEGCDGGDGGEGAAPHRADAAAAVPSWPVAEDRPQLHGALRRRFETLAGPRAGSLFELSFAGAQGG